MRIGGRLSILLALACLATAGCSVNEVVVAEETELIGAESPVDDGVMQFTRARSRVSADA